MTVEINLLALLHRVELAGEAKPEHGDNLQRRKHLTDKFIEDNSRVPDARYTVPTSVPIGQLPPMKDVP